MTYLHDKVEKDGRTGVQAEILDGRQTGGAAQDKGEEVRHGRICTGHQNQIWWVKQQGVSQGHVRLVGNA